MNKVFLTSYDQAYQFFTNMIGTHEIKTYVVDEDEMIIELVETLAGAHEFFNPEPIDFSNVLSGLIKTLECSTYNESPTSRLMQGAPLQVEFLDVVLKQVQFDDTHIKLHKMVVCQHDKRHYEGFTERYTYCEKCGVKNI